MVVGGKRNVGGIGPRTTFQREVRDTRFPYYLNYFAFFCDKLQSSSKICRALELVHQPSLLATSTLLLYSLYSYTVDMSLLSL